MAFSARIHKDFLVRNLGWFRDPRTGLFDCSVFQDCFKPHFGEAGMQLLREWTRLEADEAARSGGFEPTSTI